MRIRHRLRVHLMGADRLLLEREEGVGILGSNRSKRWGSDVLLRDGLHGRVARLNGNLDADFDGHLDDLLDHLFDDRFDHFGLTRGVRLRKRGGAFDGRVRLSVVAAAERNRELRALAGLRILNRLEGFRDGRKVQLHAGAKERREALPEGGRARFVLGVERERDTLFAL